MNEEMRKEFEGWFCNEYSHGGGIPNYGCSTTNIAWKAWQASREAMKPIKLPDMQDFKGVDVSWDGENETVVDVLYEDSYKDAVAEAIKQAGYKVEE